MSHQNTDADNTVPTDEAHNNRFATGFDQFDNAGIKIDRWHGKYDQRFAQSFKRSECVCWNVKAYGNCEKARVYDKVSEDIAFFAMYL